MLSNISFQISIGVTIITLIIWRLLQFKIDKINQNKNLKKLKKDVTQKEKIDKKLLIILIFGILISIILGAIFYRYTPMKTLKNNSGLSYLTNYTYNIFVMDKPYLATFISVFPIGLFISIYYIFKDENEHLYFIVPTVIVSIIDLMIISLNVRFPFLPNYILSLGFSLLQIYMMIYIFSNIEKKLFGMIKSAYISLIFLVILMFIPVPVSLNRIFIDLSYIIFVLESYIILNYSDKRFWRLGSWVFTVISILQVAGFLIVNFM